MFEVPVFDQNLPLEYLAKLLSCRFLTCLKILFQLLSKEMANNNGNLFDVWMCKLSDEIQLTSRSYGEMICLNGVFNERKYIVSLEIVRDTARLYALTILKDNLAWLILHELLTREQAYIVMREWNLAVRGFDQWATIWIEAFMIPDQLIHAPIARDWIRYNQHNNFGEVISHSKY